MLVDDFILQNADPILLQQNEMWEYIRTDEEDDFKEIKKEIEEN